MHAEVTAVGDWSPAAPLTRRVEYCSPDQSPFQRNSILEPSCVRRRVRLYVDVYWIGGPKERLGRFAVYSENDWIALESTAYFVLRELGSQ
jgi:hypothetical protein